MNKIESLINPKSIAVVGASNRPGNVGSAVFKNLLQGDYKGVLYPVHPNARSIHSVKAWKNISDIPDDVDMAVIVSRRKK